MRFFITVTGYRLDIENEIEHMKTVFNFRNYRRYKWYKDLVSDFVKSVLGSVSLIELSVHIDWHINPDDGRQGHPLRTLNNWQLTQNIETMLQHTTETYFYSHIS